jgi:TonB family protein
MSSLPELVFIMQNSFCMFCRTVSLLAIAGWTMTCPPAMCQKAGGTASDQKCFLPDNIRKRVEHCSDAGDFEFTKSPIYKDIDESKDTIKRDDHWGDKINQDLERIKPDQESHPGRAASDHKAQTDVDFGPYLADLNRRIKRVWIQPESDEFRSVVVQFKIHRDGKVSNLRLDHSSGVANIDRAALKAVENAGLRPLPEGAPEDVEQQYTFSCHPSGGNVRSINF